MSKNPRKLRDEQDGVRVYETRRRPSTAVLAVVALAAVGIFYLYYDGGEPAAREPAPPVSEPIARQPVVPAPADRLRNPAAASVAERARTNRLASIPERSKDREHGDADGDGTHDDPAIDPGAEEEDASSLDDLARNLIETLGAGGGEGLAAFPPPGTNPVKTGIIVPESFELPEGYVRYHQTTDDGKRLEPILMFSPDYVFEDDNGEPIVVPEDGIVPADMAPPGLPVRMLEVPDAPRGTGSR